MPNKETVKPKTVRVKCMFIKRMCSIFLIVVFACTHLGCAQLMVLPLFILSLPFQILNLFIRLLPTLIKYAPLALLLVEKGDKDSLENLYQTLDSFDKNGQMYSLEMCSLPDDVTCYKIVFHENTHADAALTATMTDLLQNIPNARLLLVGKEIKDFDEQGIYSMWQYMERHNMKIGYDSRLLTIAKDDLSAIEADYKA
jgi:hypothetical protein